MSDVLVSIERTTDSIKYNKDCRDFISKKDGTIVGESKYCEMSELCHQMDMLNGRPVQMESHYLPITDSTTGEVIEWQYFCTGVYDFRPLKERMEDNKVS